MDSSDARLRSSGRRQTRDTQIDRFDPNRRRDTCVGFYPNKGEALHALRGFLFSGDSGKVRRKQEEEQNNQASCLNLLTNAVVAWNTVYMAAVLDQLRSEGYPVRDEELVHLSPARYEHINPYGKFRFALDEVLSLNKLRPLRTP